MKKFEVLHAKPAVKWKSYSPLEGHEIEMNGAREPADIYHFVKVDGTIRLAHFQHHEHITFADNPKILWEGEEGLFESLLDHEIEYEGAVWRPFDAENWRFLDGEREAI